MSLCLNALSSSLFMYIFLSLIVVVLKWFDFLFSFYVFLSPILSLTLSLSLQFLSPLSLLSFLDTLRNDFAVNELRCFFSFPPQLDYKSMWESAFANMLAGCSVTKLGNLWRFGQLLKAPVATIIFPRSPTFKAIFVKGSKSFIFLVKSFLGNFYRTLATFYWSRWLVGWEILKKM